MPTTLNLTLTPANRPGLYTLTADGVSYPIELRPDADVALGELLRRLQLVLSGEPDPASSSVTSDGILREVGVRLWRALTPDTAPADTRAALARLLLVGTVPLQLHLPAALATLPWELLCDPDTRGDSAFLARRRPLVRLSASPLPLGEGQGEGLPPLTPPLRSSTPPPRPATPTRPCRARTSPPTCPRPPRSLSAVSASYAPCA